MFSGCTNLVEAPELPATELADYCYYEMFSGCANLVEAPKLPATKLVRYIHYGDYEYESGNQCYSYMFADCTSLAEAPELPATELTPGCYSHMFSGCTSLNQIPNLPATKLVPKNEYCDGCYDSMFAGCSGLNLTYTQDDTHNKKWEINIPEESDLEPEDWGKDMFAGCTGVDFGNESNTPDLNVTYYQFGFCDHEFVEEINPDIPNQLASKATCVAPAKYYKYCSICEELSDETFEAGEVDKTNHVGETEIRGAKSASCTEDGYTGDTYCKSCNTKISDGTAIKATGHKFDAGKVTKEPTVDAEGIKTFTCTVCGATKTEPIAKLPKPAEPEPTPEPDLPGEEFAEYAGNTFTMDEDGDVRCFDSNGNPVIDSFQCDGTYTYYFQYDGTAMKDRLTYHPDGEHVIYFDENGHEVFSDFANVKKSISGDAVDDMCFFNVYGYMYVDTLTYDKTGTKLYYVNPYGVLERKGWFAFSGNEFDAGLGFSGRAGGYGYANADCSLVINTYTYDWDGNYVYIQGDGHMFR